MAESIYVLYLLDDGNLATGKAKFIVEPTLPVDHDELWSSLVRWMNQKTVVKIRSHVSNIVTGTTFEFNDQRARISAVAETKEEIDKEWRVQAAQQERLKAARLQRAKEAEKATAPPAKKRLFASRVPSFQDCLSPTKVSESGMSSPASSLPSSSSQVSPEKYDENEGLPLTSGEQTTSSAKESAVSDGGSSQNNVEFQEATLDDIMALDTGEETPRKKVKKLESTVGELQSEIEGYKEKIASLESAIEEYKIPAEDRLAKRITESVKAAWKEDFNNYVSSGASVANSFSTPRHRPQQAASQKVPLYKGYSLMIDTEDLNLVVNFGKKSSERKHLKLFVNKIMEGVYTRSYMGTHCLTGSRSGKHPKEALPEADINAITLFAEACWQKWHKKLCEDGDIRTAIKDKLQTENRSFLNKGTSSASPAGSSKDGSINTPTHK